MSSSDKRPSRTGGLRIGYVLKRFPRLSETFVLNEMLALERQGIALDIYSLKRPLDEPRHAALDQLKARVVYVSDQVVDADATVSDSALASTLALLSGGKRPCEHRNLLAKAQAIARLTRAADVRHLHAHFASDAATAALLAGRAANLPFSFTAHARDIYHCYVSPEVDNAARRAKIAAAEFVATVSEYNRRYLSALAGPAHAPKIVRIYNGVDLAQLAWPCASTRARNCILSVGRLVEKKGFSDLIEACRILASRGLDFSCEIIGDGPIGPALRKQIAACGLEAHVNLSGPRTHNEVVPAMQHASVLALPCVVSSSGDQDGLPTVLLEALALGLPAVSTRMAGIPEIITDNQTGLLVDPRSPLALADALARLLADETLRERIAAAGREKAEQVFDLEENAATLGQFLLRSAGALTAHRERRADAYRVSLG